MTEGTDCVPLEEDEVTVWNPKLTSAIRTVEWVVVTPFTTTVCVPIVVGKSIA